MGVAGVHSGVYVRASEVEPYLQAGDKVLFINEFSTAKMSLPSARLVFCFFNAGMIKSPTFFY